MVDTLRFNVCKELSPLEDVDASEQVRILDTPCTFFLDNPRSVRVNHGPV